MRELTLIASVSKNVFLVCAAFLIPQVYKLLLETRGGVCHTAAGTSMLFQLACVTYLIGLCWAFTQSVVWAHKLYVRVRPEKPDDNGAVDKA